MSNFVLQMQMELAGGMASGKPCFSCFDRFCVQAVSSKRMASGWGITGNKGRCYDFWIDFSECMSGCREPKDCALLREDYLECLHHSKEFQRRNRIYKEEQRQLRAASRKAKEGGDGNQSHH
ncbi:hypothetical protein Nepgr_009862 [Nepenthes gracilis]|uniref:NADH dehydrogenase [ubiquinone] iron-sulfur protein 5-B n=1 Tax=Nepenthes gracilis TaxID=150966 RepID=A0AAD3XKJ1_NEPGR|nr:hypothetical protein Nepgr_009862 [Nepenthes gracilis]